MTLTKLRNETAKKMSEKVILKGLGANTVGGIISNLYSGVKQTLTNTFNPQIRAAIR